MARFIRMERLISPCPAAAGAESGDGARLFLRARSIEELDG